MGLTQASIVTLGLFVVGLVYHAGAMAERVKQLEKWREEMRADVTNILRSIDECKALIRGEDT